MIRIFTIPFSTANETFFEDDLNQFLLNKKVKNLKAEFFKSRENFYWTILIDFDPVIEERISKKTVKPKLNEKDELLFKRLKEWRKQRAEKEGIPVYIVATNEQLLAAIHSKPGTKEALKMLKGFGKKKIEKYGEDILKVIGGFLNEKANPNI